VRLDLSDGSGDWRRLLGVPDAAPASASSPPALDDGTDFETFCRDVLPRVYGYLLVRCGSASLAEELTSEVFLAAARQHRDGNRDARSLPWLLTVARRRLVDHWRREDREQRRLSLVWAANRDTTSGQFESVLLDEEAERQRRSRAALDRLRAEHRLVLVLRYLDGEPVGAIAEALGRSLHATESLLARARRGFAAAYTDLERRDA
jgi:RNA polymerase sigma-70 factor (ECF subfamily)